MASNRLIIEPRVRSHSLGWRVHDLQTARNILQLGAEGITSRQALRRRGYEWSIAYNIKSRAAQLDLYQAPRPTRDVTHDLLAAFDREGVGEARFERRYTKPYTMQFAVTGLPRLGRYAVYAWSQRQTQELAEALSQGSTWEIPLASFNLELEFTGLPAGVAWLEALDEILAHRRPQDLHLLEFLGILVPYSQHPNYSQRIGSMRSKTLIENTRLSEPTFSGDSNRLLQIQVRPRQNEGWMGYEEMRSVQELMSFISRWEWHGCY